MDKPFIPVDILEECKRHPNHCSECGWHFTTGHRTSCSLRTEVPPPPPAESRLSDERLDEVESYSGKVRVGDLDDYHDQLMPRAVSVGELVAEIRRLRRQNLLLHLSRGTPSPFGQVAADIENLRHIVGLD